MLWYELADANEVKEVLEQFLLRYKFAVHKIDRWSRDENGNVAEWISYPSQAYEIAEALWGEYSEENE